ncbi:amino acid aminotransferase [Parvularcula marina]|uniref:Aminotransferase n=1 Tax=Parvularcula marina TaxID=2292771 RepID=A0A371RH34_9PROT|nr:amino acid aminotransferase [Parvularcula marina]RFB04749.1 aspartate/tyrosine/aromatic aminotransferase [Parvularcula marina]
MSQFDSLTPRPADALLGLMAAFRADPREEKIDLGVGVYRDDAGQTTIMKAVREAERRLAETSQTKVYESPRGNQDFTAAIDRFIFADDETANRQGFATPGGSGALSLGMNFIKRITPDATVWISDPSWPNHPHIARTASLNVASYAYAQPADPGIDLDKLMESLSAAKPGDAIIIQGPCHNPTGIDLDTAQWKALGAFCAEKGLMPFIDMAYHGFAQSLDEDVLGVRAFLGEVPEALFSYSCSKNFGLYRDRAGCLLLKASSETGAQNAGTHLADIARALWSMPPAHGPAIVSTILGDEALTTMWKTELVEMQDRMGTLRRALAESIHPNSNSYDPSVLTSQNGMFSQLPLAKPVIEELREKEGLYIPGSGRINIAGLSMAQTSRVAELLSPHL